MSALSERAARGAGFPPAQAALFGRAVVMHMAHGGPEDALLEALATPKDSPILRLPLVLDDLMRILSQMPEGGALTLLGRDTRLALAYARLAPVTLSLDIATRADGTHSLVFAPGDTPADPPPAGLDPSADLVRALSKLASKTYVPASVGGRHGAGAGNIDND
ncbi:hypothetical protein [Cognatishimia sp. F0-27]|uniref:hypothetical protein n=1 Tax=Cognatishimia sp. F0-27 TaxID=2816855 RepID=UPI001D0C9D7C|nr:hypothetical protein [Cognatishimia sp. F0-27]MCC1491951.1 hypothetical protein [Cognatishimia sp. F0-27]